MTRKVREDSGVCPEIRYWLIRACCGLLAAAAAGCAGIPNISDRLHAAWIYRHPPQFVGVHGPLSTEQSAKIIQRLATHTGSATVLQQHLAVEQAIGGSPLVLGNKVTLLKNDSETYRAMFAAIEGAENNICLETFIFTDDPIGQKFADALIAKQRQGVQVNVIYDSAGSLLTPDSFMNRMRAAGIRVLEFNPINPFERRFHGAFSHRDHRKILTIDGRIAFTGGINIAAVGSGTSSTGEGNPGTTVNYWRDTDVMIEGPAVAELQQLFLGTWEAQRGHPLSPRDYFPTPRREGKVIVRVLGSQAKEVSIIYITLISAINAASKNIYITDAYFAPDWQMQSALKAAAHRGVDVELLLPKQSDHVLVVSAARAHYAGLLKAGVKIFEWQGEMLHAKTATIDGVWSTVGSSNLDWWSIVRDNEVNAVMISDDFGEKMDAMFDDDLKNSKEIKRAEWRERPLLERTQEWIARLLEPLL
jgi:cardiolipin synthase